MVLVLWRDSDESTLVTVGDAIESFLQRPDPTTENCLSHVPPDYQENLEGWTGCATAAKIRCDEKRALVHCL